MIDLLGAFSALRVTAANLFRKKVTEPLPWQGGRARPERYRTSFALVHNEDGDEACIGCKMCEKICPSAIISVQPGGKSKQPSGKMRGTAKAFTLDLNACIHCELCVQVCPEDAILMLRVPETPGFSREDVFLTMEKLYKNEPVQKAWGTGALLVAMQEPAKPAPKAVEATPKVAEAPKVEAPKAEAPPVDAPKVDAGVAESRSAANAPAAGQGTRAAGDEASAPAAGGGDPSALPPGGRVAEGRVRGDAVPAEGPLRVPSPAEAASASRPPPPPEGEGEARAGPPSAVPSPTNATDVPTPTIPPMPFEPDESTTIVPKPSGEGASS